MPSPLSHALEARSSAFVVIFDFLTSLTFPSIGTLADTKSGYITHAFLVSVEQPALRASPAKSSAQENLAYKLATNPRMLTPGAPHHGNGPEAEAARGRQTGEDA